MGKRKDNITEEKSIADELLMSSQPAKKHKKHKHKKHKKKKSESDNAEGKILSITSNEEDIDTVNMSPNQMKATTSVPSISSTPPKSAKKKKKGKDSGSSEEERWLDAIESGKLEEVDDELKKIKPKDPKLMTARQRAMLERKAVDKEPNAAIAQGSGEQLLALPTGYREKVMTPEMALKAQLKSQKRKQQADEKREKDKKKTMERLLRKQESKPVKASGKSRPLKRQTPSVILCSSQLGISITLPLGMDFPLTPVRVTGPPSPKLCGVSGCSNPKSYSCAKTGVPLCSSLKCYQKNICTYRHSVL